MSKPKHRYQSTKKFDNFSVALRQHKASHSHCKDLHGYSFEIKVWFASTEPEIDKQLDEMSWIVDYGGFKDAPKGNGMRSWLDHMFDHTTLIEQDDPYRDLFESMQMEGICKVHFLEKMGAESLAKLVFDKFNDVLSKTNGGKTKCTKVEFYENPKNSSIYEEIN